MPKPSIYPERLNVRLPGGTSERILRVTGVNVADRKSGQDVYGPVLRKWVLERLAAEEEAQGSAPALASPADPSERQSWLERAAALLDDPVTRDRFQRRILMSEDDRGRAAARQG